MGAVTYPDAAVGRYILEHFVPIQFNVVEQPHIKDQFYADWTPTIMTQNAAGREARRCEGYHGPRQFIGELSLGRVKAALYEHDYAAAPARVTESIDLTHGDGLREPEAYYWAAVAAYRSSGDGKKLDEGWDRVIAQFPDSDWARRADI